MARPKTPTLTDAELRVMDVVWRLGQASVNDVLAAFPLEGRPAYNTVLTTLRILESKGHLSHTKEGRAHLFRPLSSRNQARRQAVRHMVSCFFSDSPSLLLRSMLEEEDLSGDEIAELKRMIARHASVDQE